ncbi:unnamed protein product [Rhizopus stolonifer]
MTTAREQEIQKNFNQEKNLAALGVFEEDDEFEEFIAEDWVEVDKSDSNFWDDNWDDNDIEDDLSSQLSTELKNEPNQSQHMKL